MAWAAGMGRRFVPFPYGLKIRVGGRPSFGIGIAEGTRQIAAAGHFEQNGAGALSVVGAKAAVERASPVNGVIADGGRGGDFGPFPRRECRRSLPDQGLEGAMIGAVLDQKNPVSLLPPLRGEASQADGTKAAGPIGVKHGFQPAGSKPLSIRISIFLVRYSIFIGFHRLTAIIR